jgi:hypothetical protein
VSLFVFVIAAGEARAEEQGGLPGTQWRQWCAAPAVPAPARLGAAAGTRNRRATGAARVALPRCRRRPWNEADTAVPK